MYCFCSVVFTVLSNLFQPYQIAYPLYSTGRWTVAFS